VIKKEWYECWFDSPYYHVLYKERDEQEAQAFLDNLCTFLNPKKNATVLDVACGKGRHSLYLQKKEFIVTGFDLSPENIEYDLQFENETLSFFKHDMRELFRINYFDFVFNLFSSFGYFEKESDHAKTIYSHASALKPGGILVVDYMNAEKVKTSFVADETREVDGILFRINRRIENNKIIKTIRFNENGEDLEFEEQVRLFSKTDFENYFNQYHLKLLNTFGDYHLGKFDPVSSDRLILIATKA